MSFSNSQTKKTSYVPPSMRTQSTAIKPTKKKEPKKEFSLDTDAFPSLVSKKCKSSSLLNPNSNDNNTINFSAAAAKKIEEKKEAKNAEVLPGWVMIRRQAGNFQYKYGAPIPYDYNAEERREMALGNQLFKYLLERAQYERDMDVLRLGDLSEFYDKPSLAEIFENDVVAGYDRENAGSDYDSSSNSDDE